MDGLNSAAGWYLLRLAAVPAVSASIAVGALLLLLLLGQSLALAPLSPGLPGIAQVGLGLIPGVLTVALPVGLLFGLISASRAWAERGEWLALACSGAPARRVVRPVLAVGVLTAIVLAGLTHVAEPLGRRQARRALSAAVDDLTVQPGRPVVLGETLLVARVVEGKRLGEVVVAAGAVLTTAREAQLLGDGQLLLQGGSAVGLSSDPSAADPEAWRLHFTSARLRLELPGTRVELIERSDSELLDLIARARQAGQQPDAARRTLARRSVLPAAIPVLALLALPLGARSRRPGLAAVSTVLAWWAVLRVADQLSPQMGPLVAAWSPFVLLGLLAAMAWWTWGEA